tara:strand:+ start:1129 stop:1353 length:225 start_codon:yes stop_codon:yes gene_type:complete
MLEQASDTEGDSRMDEETMQQIRELAEEKGMDAEQLAEALTGGVPEELLEAMTVVLGKTALFDLALTKKDEPAD